MFIQFIIDGVNMPVVMEVGPKANKLAYELERKGKKFRFGNIVN